MEHKIIPATLKTEKALIELIQQHETDGWSVAAFGEVFGGDILVLSRGAHKYEHRVVPVTLKTRQQVEEIIVTNACDDWQVCAIGEHFDGVLLVLKRIVPVK